MRSSRIVEVERCMKELQRRIDLLFLARQDGFRNYMGTVTAGYPKETGAIRRASMELTRALAELRKPDYPELPVDIRGNNAHI